ncbi:hypothetical protein [Kitasatospora sp. GAS204B]|uniref:hypothetical protein n=1 Tax=unclassified Kitasatospora TaxID=2633591 RepID=UPI002476843B|nr:hypothetical protein [Kitasatospora sp. GAS204B]MDH6117938.1 hypothetical protein [Kitasatospora sp. GAS204B]
MLDGTTVLQALGGVMGASFPEQKGSASQTGSQWRDREPDLSSRLGARAVIIAAVITAVGAVVAAVISVKG